MKKLSDIKIGILIGIIASCAILAFQPISEHFASAVTSGDIKNVSVEASSFYSTLLKKVGGTNGRLEYDDVFASASFKNLYILIYQYAFVDPEDEALKTIAAAYGFTLAEAQSVLDGSLQPLMTKYGGGTNRTQQDIYNIENQFREDFMEIYTTLTLEQELTIGGVASEIFSNGEVTDSGFDLVHDLTVIEEVIFGTTTDASLGGPLKFGGVDDKEDATDELIASGDADTAPNIPDVYNELGTTDVSEEETSVETAEDSSLESFDPTSLVQIQEDDLCPKPETNIENALDNFKKSNPDNIGTVIPETPKENTKPTISEAAAKTAAANPDSLVDVLIPEVADDWYDTPKCNGFFYSLKGNSEEGRITQDMTGQGQTVLAGSEDSTETSSEEADDGKPGSPIAAEFFICLEATTKWAKYGTVVADKPCVKCETEKILAYLNKTLENSFVPNKVTGNFLEPSKCKSAFSSAIDIKLNLIWNPVQTPKKDESNKLKSLRKEWDKLTSRSNPLGLKDLPMSWLGDNINTTAIATAKQNSSEAATYSELMEQVSVIKNSFAKKAAEGNELFSTISSGENFVTYSQDVIKEIDQMTNYFLNFKTIFAKLSDTTCPHILSKEKVN